MCSSSSIYASDISASKAPLWGSSDIWWSRMRLSSILWRSIYDYHFLLYFMPYQFEPEFKSTNFKIDVLQDPCPSPSSSGSLSWKIPLHPFCTSIPFYPPNLPEHKWINFCHLFTVYRNIFRSRVLEDLAWWVTRNKP